MTRQLRCFVVCGLAQLVAACASPGAPGPGAGGASPAGVSAIALGVTIDARDARGAPRLVRAIAPRPVAAGTTPEQAARTHLAAIAPLWLAQQPAAELAAAPDVQRLRNGASIVRLQQQVDQVPFHQGEMRVMLGADGSLSAISGTLRPRVGPASFRLTATAAMERALDVHLGASRARPAIREAAVRAGYQELVVAPAGFTVDVARARREWFADGDRTYPIWSVDLAASQPGFDGRTERSAKRYLIDDGDGTVIREVDLTRSDSFVYRAFAETTGNRRPLDGALEGFTPHPTGVPDGSLPGLGPYNLVVADGFNAPGDPWLGPMATTTSGNNVEAFADITAPEGFNEGDIRPEVRAGRVLNYIYDFTAEPLASTTQSKAAAVNLFYVTNWLHDWWYDSGFTEAAGNAQVDNYGRGGIEGDPLQVHAQDDAIGGSRDNAFATVFPDGFSPQIDMFLWSGFADTRLTAPIGTPATMSFLQGPHTFDLTGTAVLAQDTTGGGHTACVPVSGEVAGQIAVFEAQGVCPSMQSVDNLKAAGAIGVIAVFEIPGLAFQILNGSPTANLPGVVVNADDGRALEAVLPASVALHRTTTTEHDGDLDNAIIAHEWGHYLHLRLASCELVQCAAMSEGWGDFVALHMMRRDGDARDGTYGLNLYSLTAGGWQQQGNADPGYFGIRRYPYSTDRSKNGLSFRHIAEGAALPDTPTNPGPVQFGNSEVHNAGEVWASMLWESYNVLIDQHGFDEARRRMSDYVVAGLLMTPPDATYTEGRDAIVAAAGALDTDDMLLIAAAFAGRGAGTCAVSPARDSGDLTSGVESGTLAAKIEVGKPALTDDRTSCDHDGFLDPGESGTLRVTVSNIGVVPAENVVVTATAATRGVSFGPPIHVGILGPSSQIDVAIPVAVTPGAPVATALSIAVRVDSTAGCGTGHLTTSLDTVMGVDAAAAVSTTDDFEHAPLAWTPAGDGAEGIWRLAAEPSGNHVVVGDDTVFASDTQLVSPVLQASSTAPLVVTLQHAYNLFGDPGFGGIDGGVIEVSSDGGATWRDVTELGIDPGYPLQIFNFFGDPLANRWAFSGPSPGFPQRQPLRLDFGTQLAGQAVQLRFRTAALGLGCCTGQGWFLDDIAVSGITNTPFPGLVPEPTVCFAHATHAADDTGAGAAPATGVTAARTMPKASLARVRLP